MEIILSLFLAGLASTSVGSRTTLYFDREANVTPQVIDKSIVEKVTTVQTQNGALNVQSRNRNLEQLEVHCLRSLKALGLAEHSEACDLN